MHTTCLIAPQGPLLQVTILTSYARQQALSAAGQPIAAPITATMLIDTGATCTNLDLQLIQKLALNPTGSVPVHTPSTGTVPVMQQVYDIGLVVHGQGPTGSQVHYVPNLPILGSDFSAQGIDGLIGRDVLKHCRMSYSGPDGLLLLSF